MVGLNSKYATNLKTKISQRNLIVTIVIVIKASSVQVSAWTLFHFSFEVPFSGFVIFQLHRLKGL